MDLNNDSQAGKHYKDQGAVEHRYHDHSYDVDPRSLGVSSSPSWRGVVAPAPGAHMNGGTAPSCQQPFPVRLHYVLEEMERDGLSHIASWQPHGRCFLVQDREKFVQKILPIWFAQNSYASFQRQLNIYGFKRLTHGPDKGGYYNELFLRGMRFLACSIPRTKIKNNGHRQKASPDSEPNFYKMSFVPHSGATVGPAAAGGLLFRSQPANSKRPMSLTSLLLPPSRALPFMNSHSRFVQPPGIANTPMHYQPQAPTQLPYSNQMHALLRPATQRTVPPTFVPGLDLPPTFADDRDHHSQAQQGLDADLARTLLEPIIDVEPVPDEPLFL